jgi:hypothetical protein
MFDNWLGLLRYSFASVSTYVFGEQARAATTLETSTRDMNSSPVTPERNRNATHSSNMLLVVLLCKVLGVVAKLHDATSMYPYGQRRSRHIATVLVLQRVSDMRPNSCG